MKKNNKTEKLLIKIIIILVLVIVFLLIMNYKKITAKDCKINNDNVEKQNLNTENVIIVKKDDEENVKNMPVNENTVKDEKKESRVENINSNRKFGKNVAFIGDSRTQAFLLYTGLKDITDYTNVGLMVDTAISKKFVKNEDGERITILQDLKNKDINTIYIMLGINELGWVYSSIFIQKYEELIDEIRKIKPDVEIIVQSIIPVTKIKSDNNKTYNNNRIKEYNKLIKDMTQRKNVKYIDLVPELSDSNGYLPNEASVDGIHLTKKYCLKWLECLKNN